MSSGMYIFPESILEVFLVGWRQNQEMQEAERILNDEAAERLAPPILTESSVVPASAGEATMQDDPLPMRVWNETTSQGVEARVVQLLDG
eukprot:7272200-Alexandrium_andersonii.AAC.1